MGGRARSTGLTLFGAAALLLSACGGGPVATVGPSAAGPSAAVSATSMASAPAATGAAEVGPFARDPVVADASSDAQIRLEAAISAAVVDARRAARMAESLGPDSPALASAMDDQVSRLLSQAVADALASAPIQLVSTHLPAAPVTVDPGPAAAPAPGQLASGTLIASLALLEKSIGSTSPYSKATTSSEEASIGADKGSIQTDVTVVVTPSGSKVTVDVEQKTSGSVTDASGKLLFKINAVSKAHIEADGCPDANGVAAAHVEISNTEEYFAGGDLGHAGHAWSGTDKGDIKIFANEQAEVDRVQMDMQGDSSIKGGSRAAGAGQSDLTAFSVGVAESLTMDGGFGAVLGASSSVTSSDGATKSEAGHALDGLESTVSLVALTASKAASSFWRSGRCIEVVIDPAGGNVAKDSTTTVTAKVRHRFEGNELDKPVKATLSGVKSIEPSGQNVKAPATFTYTAGPKEDDKGTVTFKSVSNRGIGETTVTFTVGGGWIIEGSNGPAIMKGQKCNGVAGEWVIHGVLSSGALAQTETFHVTIDGASLHGTYTYLSPWTMSGGVGSVKGSGSASIVVLADGSVTMTLSPSTATSEGTLAGTHESLQVPIPGWTFPWKAGGDCPKAPA
jgi:hypothetical protein